MNTIKGICAAAVVACWCLLLGAPPAHAAGQGGMLDAILGVTVGMPESQARALLEPLGETAGRDTRSGGRKQGFLVDDERFAWVAYKAGHGGTLKWVSANLRPGAEIEFSELGDLSLADSANDYQVIWNVARPGGGYRLVAKGQGGRASIVYLLALD